MDKRKYEMTIKETLEWAKSYPKVKSWLKKLQREDLNARSLWLFCKTVGKNPDELLALKDDPKSREAEYLLDNFVIPIESSLADTITTISLFMVLNVISY